MGRAMSDDPHALFDRWLEEAGAAEPNDANAMALATVDAKGQPSARMVLLKGHDARGFAFYTNSESRKGRELAGNPRAALLFHWKSLRRQVRAEGHIEPVSPEEADAYFASRSRDSRIGAWASDQSRPLESRPEFEARYAKLAREFDGEEIGRPPHWWGYRLVPERIEFWTDRPHRLHERRLFTRGEDGWTEGLLYP
jgi:pyridoxamine 5'-phosphate oxidase